MRLWREVRRALLHPCPAYLTNYGVRGELWELGEVIISDPKLASRVEALFIRLDPQRATARKPDWLRNLRE